MKPSTDSGISMSSVLFDPVRKLAARFIADRNGNIAVIFAFASVPLLTLIGVAVDYSRATAARTAMQSAVDSAALMASKDYASGAISESQIPAKVNSYLRALYTPQGITDISVEATFTKKSSDGTSTVAVTSTGKVPTSFMKFANVDAIPFKTSSTSTWGATRLRVAIALDVTGSMNSAGKLAAMKTAAVKLVNTLKATASADADVYISIVPFNIAVNVGTANKDAAWLDWDTDFGNCKSKYTTKSACEAGGDTWKSSSSTCKSTKVLKSACEAGGHTWDATNVDDWQGCVADRTTTGDYDTIKDAPTQSVPATLFLAKNYSTCKASLMPMKPAYKATESDTSTDDTTLKGKINTLVADGNTNQSIGMFWAWMSLQTGAPLNTPAKETDYKYTDAIILLSDGDNTGTLPKPFASKSSMSQSQIDTRQKKLCDSIKNPANGVTTVFTIQVNTNGDDESAVLKYCANSGQFFQSTTSDQIDLAFQAIGSSLTKLRLQQ
jgi:Flp pilus assembly protein TadG